MPFVHRCDYVWKEDTTDWPLPWQRMPLGFLFCHERLCGLNGWGRTFSTQLCKAFCGEYSTSVSPALRCVRGVSGARRRCGGPRQGQTHPCLLVWMLARRTPSRRRALRDTPGRVGNVGGNEWTALVLLEGAVNLCGKTFVAHEQPEAWPSVILPTHPDSYIFLACYGMSIVKNRVGCCW